MALNLAKKNERKPTMACHKTALGHCKNYNKLTVLTMYCSFQPKLTLVAVKQQLLVFIFTQVMMTGAHV